MPDATWHSPASGLPLEVPPHHVEDCGGILTGEHWELPGPGKTFEPGE